MAAAETRMATEQIPPQDGGVAQQGGESVVRRERPSALLQNGAQLVEPDHHRETLGKRDAGEIPEPPFKRLQSQINFL